MDRFNEMLRQIGARLALLTVSQRIAIGLCAAMVAASLMWLVQWSSVPVMVPVFEGEFRWDQLSTAEGALQQARVAYRTQGRRILVPVAARDNAIRILNEQDAVPEDGGFDIDALIEGTTPFKPESDKAFERNVAWGNKLAQIITTSPLVMRAAVMINPTTTRRIGHKTDVPTASVTVMLRPGADMDRDMVRGMAAIVSRAVAGLEIHNVDVIDGATLKRFAVPAPGEAQAVGFLDEVGRHERHLQEKVEELLVYVPHAIVNVSVELDNSRSRTEKQVFDKPQVKTEDTRNQQSSARQTPSEPGVNANVGMGITAGGGGQGTSSEDAKTEFFAPNLREKTTIEQIAPQRRRVTASVLVPRSWLVSVFQAAQPGVERPTDDDLKDVRSIELRKIADGVSRVVLADANNVANDVTVDVYPDLDGGGYAPGGPQIAGVSGGGSADALSMARTYGPQVGLGVLAMVSLVMMMRVVRKTSRLVDTHRAGDGEDEDEEPTDEDAVLQVSGGPVGQAALTGGFLHGQELSEDELRYQELSQQVSNLVESDPTGAAELLAGWIKEEP